MICFLNYAPPPYSFHHLPVVVPSAASNSAIHCGVRAHRIHSLPRSPPCRHGCVGNQAFKAWTTPGHSRSKLSNTACLFLFSPKYFKTLELALVPQGNQKVQDGRDETESSREGLWEWIQVGLHWFFIRESTTPQRGVWKYMGFVYCLVITGHLR